jgi:hypothetical protein
LTTLRPATCREGSKRTAGGRPHSIFAAVFIFPGRVAQGNEKMKIWHNGFWRAFSSVAFVRESKPKQQKARRQPFFLVTNN